MQAFRMRVTQIILTKLFLITPPETLICKVVANWFRLGYELSVVNLTPYVV